MLVQNFKYISISPGLILCGDTMGVLWIEDQVHVHARQSTQDCLETESCNIAQVGL